MAVSAHSKEQSILKQILALKFRHARNNERARDKKEVSSSETEREKRVHKESSIKVIKMSLA